MIKTTFNSENNLLACEKQEDIYGNRIAERDNANWEAAFYSTRRRLVVFASNIRDEFRLRRAINHELVGHYGTLTLESAEKTGIRIDGEYLPVTGTINLFAGSFDNIEHIKETIRHELSGHWSINTLSPIEKRDLLARN